MKKTLTILSIMSIVLFTMITIASATVDVATNSIIITPNQPIEGQNVVINVTITNVGDENYTASTNALTVDFNDTTSQTADVPTVLVGASTTISFNHVYTTAGDYVIKATYNKGDDNATNDETTKTITIIAKNYDISVPTYTATIKRDASQTISGDFISAGNVDTTVVLKDISNVINTENDSQIISASDVSFSTTSFTLAPSETKNINLSIAKLAKTLLPGMYEGTFNASYDGAQYKTGIIRITVENNAPSITTIPDQTIFVGKDYTYQVQASDIEGEPLTYSITGPSGIHINSTTGLISWTPGTQIIDATITVIVSDGLDSTTEQFKISAKNDVAKLSFEDEELVLGDSSQARETTASQTIKITNDGMQTITELNLELLNSRGHDPISDNYEAYVVLNKATLAPGEEAIATISITVPNSADSQKHKIGVLKITGTGNNNTIVDDVVNTYLQAESELQIQKINVIVNGKDKGSVGDGDLFDELVEGDEVELLVKLENKYSNEDSKIYNAHVDVSDTEWDLDATSDEKDIKGDDDVTVKAKFTVDKDIIEDSTTFVIEAYGRDKENGFDHYDNWNVDAEIKRVGNDVRITDISFSQNPIDCTDTTATMNVAIKNFGTNDQKDIFIYAYSDKDELDWNAKKTYISLDAGDETTRQFVIDLPKNLKENTYIVNVDVKYDISKDADKDTALLNILCYNYVPEPEQNTTTNNSDNLIINNGGTNKIQTGSTGTVIYGQPRNKFEAFTNSTTYLVLLIVLVVVILGIIIGWTASLAKKR